MVETSSAGVPEQAQAAKDEAINQASDLKDTALEHVGAVTADAKEKATNVAHDLRRELETQGDAQAKRAASALHDVGSQLSDMANAGRPGPVSDVTRQLADSRGWLPAVSRKAASRPSPTISVSSPAGSQVSSWPPLGIAGSVVYSDPAQRAEQRQPVWAANQCAVHERTARHECAVRAAARSL